MVAKVFDTADGKWDFVFNLAGETKYSQTEEVHQIIDLNFLICKKVYKENIIDVSVTCATAAAKAGVQRFIEVSTAQVYDADKAKISDFKMLICKQKASDEKSKAKPWTKLAKAKLDAEEKLRAINGYFKII